jgi:molecular chaperone DnaJ
MRLKGRGVPSLKGNGRGDLYLTLQVMLPDSSNPDARAGAEKMQRAYPQDVRSEVRL